MYTRFHDNTIETKFVKQLVANTQVPFISTWKPGDFAIRGMVYITKDAIWKCNHTGFPKHIMDTCTPAEHVRVLDKGVPKPYAGTEAIPYFTKVAPYVFGKEYYNITGSYRSSILGYDATTHFYLGQYLRMMRDLFDLNLMPFYNCFCGEYISSFDFNSDSKIVKSTTDQFKIASVPVKFGRTYTIAIDSDVPVETMLVVYGQKGLLQELTDNLNDVIATDSSSKKTYFKYQHTSFQHPVKYTTKSWHQLYNTYVRKNGQLVSELDDNELIMNSNYDQALGQFEKYLRLLIKVPVSNKSSLVVLEGDYTLHPVYESVNSCSITWTNMNEYDTTVNNKVVTGQMVRPRIVTSHYTYEDVYQQSGTDVYETIRKVNWEPTNTQVNEQLPFLSPLGLLQMSDGNSYAFSNRLIEYLLQNVINPMEQLGDNIYRIQQYATSYENTVKNNTQKYSGAIVPGVWDESLQKYLFELVQDSKYLTTKVDLTGYVDKDTERIITRGQNV